MRCWIFVLFLFYLFLSVHHFAILGLSTWYVADRRDRINTGPMGAMGRRKRLPVVPSNFLSSLYIIIQMYFK